MPLLYRLRRGVRPVSALDSQIRMGYVTQRRMNQAQARNSLRSLENARNKRRQALIAAYERRMSQMQLKLDWLKQQAAVAAARNAYRVASVNRRAATAAAWRSRTTPPRYRRAF